jgi:predicted HAD superfamily phosphohydrolase YqeG
MIKRADEGVYDHINHFLSNKKEIEVRNRLTMMNYEEEKIEFITDRLFNNVLNKNFKGIVLHQIVFFRRNQNWP